LVVSPWQVVSQSEFFGTQVMSFPIRLADEYNTGRSRREEEADIIEYPPLCSASVVVCCMAVQ
jgi:hypothetical protein